MATLGMTEPEREAMEKLERDVIGPSMSKLVILDFWAEWCGPCKQLSPVLEKVAKDYAAKGVQLVKIDVDKDKVIAAQFRVQSIPTVYAFYQGQPVADLTNYRTEGHLSRILDELIKQLGVTGETDQQGVLEIAPLIAMAEEVLEGGDSERAVSIFRQVRELAPEDSGAAGGLARALIAAGQLAEARTELDSLPDKRASDPAIARARAMLETASAAPAVDSAELEAKVHSDPEDLDARFELAGALMAGKRRDAAANQLLAIIERDRDWKEGEARKRFLQLLEAEGLGGEWSKGQRRRLSAILFT